MSASDSTGSHDQNITGGKNQGFGYIYNAAPAAKPQAPEQASAEHTRSRSVFVVHGRDEEVRQSMFALLQPARPAPAGVGGTGAGHPQHLALPG